MRIDVKGLLMRKDSCLRGWFTKDGKELSPGEAMRYLLEELEKGHSFLPMGPCDNFDYKEGRCMGHEEKDNEQAQS